MGTWGALGPAVLSLAGVALGATGSLFGQRLTARASARQLDAQQTAAHRAELKEVILRFLGIAFRVNKAALVRVNEDGGEDAAFADLVEELWLAQAEIDLAASTEPLRGAAYRYALSLIDGGPDAETARLAQIEFMDAAYNDLWPGKRRTLNV
jgi:hypothetical protein